ncbi:MAG: hypothetical protein N2508_02265 [Anaerolineae bacterium]|nr:hypothetical protein [Anaerolineae bacterium]
MSTGKTHRLQRIFGDDGRTVIVAMDHAGVFGLTEGLGNPGELIRRIRAGGADAILTTYGICTRFAAEMGRMGVILRADGGISQLAQRRKAMSLIYSASDALRIGADGVAVMGMPGSEYEAETLPYLSALVGQCSEWGLPVLAEMLPAGFESPATWWTPENVGHACRIGAELGADLIKTVYTGSISDFRRIVEQVYVPLVVLGGARVRAPRDLLEEVAAAMEAGASGVAIGRNIFRHPEPENITAAIVAIVHGGTTVSSALGYLE